MVPPMKSSLPTAHLEFVPSTVAAPFELVPDAIDAFVSVVTTPPFVMLRLPFPWLPTKILSHVVRVLPLPTTDSPPESPVLTPRNTPQAEAA